MQRRSQVVDQTLQTSVLWGKQNCLFSVGDRSLQVALVTADKSSVPKGQSVLRIEAQRLGEVRDRTLSITRYGAGGAAIVERPRIVRV